MLVDTIEGECHIIFARAVSVKNMISGGVAYRLLCDSKGRGESHS